MNEESIERLFKPFSQADDSTTRKYGGTGLGLYISYQLAEMLGGDLTCTSVLGKGSEFLLEIRAGVEGDAEFIYDLRNVSIHERETKEIAIPQLSGNILLAEDSPDNQVLISMVIRKTGANVTVVENGKLAIEAAKENDYDLILMDMQMPIMGGLEAVKWFRESGNQTPIAMLTANAMKEEKDKCLSLGANDFLTKPIEKEQFYQALMKYLPAAEQEEVKRRNQQAQLRKKALRETQEEEQKQKDRQQMQARLEKTKAEVKTQQQQKQPTAVVDDDYDEEFEELRMSFVATLPDKMKALKHNVDAENWSEVKAEIHRLKGIGGGFDFPEITRISRDAEMHLKSSDFESALTELDALFSHCDDVINTTIKRSKAS